jgi:hypothetical protein
VAVDADADFPRQIAPADSARIVRVIGSERGVGTGCVLRKYPTMASASSGFMLWKTQYGMIGKSAAPFSLRPFKKASRISSLDQSRRPVESVVRFGA